MIKIVEAKDNVYYWNGADIVPEDVVDVVVEEGVTWLDDAGCWNRKNLISVTMPDSVEEIGGSVFRHCHSLKYVKLSSNINRIEDYAFDDCISLESITIPDNVVEIGYCAFSGCTNLSDVDIQGNPDIEKDAFYETPVENKFKETKLSFQEWLEWEYYEGFDPSGLSDEEYYELEDLYQEYLNN